ncbi:MAG: DUF3619 family protein [Burkholderiales bacterium]
MNEQQFGFRVKQVLNRSLNIEQSTLDRLKNSRLAALERHQAVAPELALAGAQNRGLINGDTRFAALRIVLSLIVLILGLFASNHWYQVQLQEEIIEIDTEVLTGDLPMDAYLDKGFDAWLKRSLD